MGLLNPMNLIPPQYKMLAYGIIAAVIVGVLFGGGYCTGYHIAENKYVAIIKTMEAEAATLRAEKAELQVKLTAEIANVKEKIITKYVDRVRVIKEKEYVYREQATNNVPDRVELSNGWVYLHDTAAAGTDVPDSTRSADETGSGVKANQALATVTDNYAACHANSEQLTALQEYVKQVQTIVAQANEVIRKNNEKK